MKKIILFVIAAVMVAACGDGPSYSSEYYETVLFEYASDYTKYEQLFGSDSTYVDATGKLGIGWGDLAFYHNLEGENLAGGFMLSYLKPAGDGTKERPEGYVPSPYRAMGLYYPLNRTYAVFCQNPDDTKMPQHDFAFLTIDYGSCTMSHCWVNNTEEVFDAVKKNFVPGDELVLMATGYLDGAKTGTAKIKMAADTTIYNWTRFDLSPLKTVEFVDFEITSTNENIPTKICMDELVAKIKIEY